MKAYRFDEFGTFDHLNPHEESMPIAGNGEVVVKVHAVSLNFRDVAMVNGTHPVKTPPGKIPNSDAAGEIVEVGPGAEPYAVGDRVIGTFHPRWFGGRPPVTMGADQYGSGRDGWLTEYKVVSSEAIVPIPDWLSYRNACTLPCAALTAWTSLGGPEPVRAGGYVLTIGTGGVSLFAVQLAKASGAHVIATTSSAETEEVLRDLGADDVINYRSEPNWGAVAKEITGGIGVDRVVEVGGPGTLPQSMAAIAVSAEIALLGFLDLSRSDIDFGELFRSGAHLRQVRVGDRSGLRSVVGAISEAGIEPVIDSVHGFDEPAAAFRRLESGSPTGKVVIEVV
jgi:NADPH:quinone reductase-like Zn-dependent oxidoreductase